LEEAVSLLQILLGSLKKGSESAGGQLWRSTCTSVLPQTVVVAGKWAKVMGEKQARLLVEAGKDGYSV